MSAASSSTGGADQATSSSEFLGPLLRTLAETLDVREVFARRSGR